MFRAAPGCICVLGILLMLAGCSTKAKKGQLSGKVTFDGKPVPAGYISFMPEGGVGGQGAVKVAQIKDGVYDTALGTDPGVTPGPTTIRIAGFDGKPQKGFAQGKQIFNPYQVHANLPEGATSQDFIVPASAAANLRIEPTSDEP